LVASSTRTRSLCAKTQSSASPTWVSPPPPCRAKRGQLEKFDGLLPESQGQNLALTVLYVPNLLDSGPAMTGVTVCVSCFIQTRLFRYSHRRRSEQWLQFPAEFQASAPLPVATDANVAKAATVAIRNPNPNPKPESVCGFISAKVLINCFWRDEMCYKMLCCH